MLNTVLFCFFTGVVGTVKAVISEVSDDSTQAFGVTVLGVSWSLGIILGPAISGAISDPIGQYNVTFDSKFEHRCCIICQICVVVSIA